MQQPRLFRPPMQCRSANPEQLRRTRDDAAVILGEIRAQLAAASRDAAALQGELDETRASVIKMVAVCESHADAQAPTAAVEDGPAARRSLPPGRLREWQSGVSDGHGAVGQGSSVADGARNVAAELFKFAAPREVRGTHGRGNVGVVERGGATASPARDRAGARRGLPQPAAQSSSAAAASRERWADERRGASAAALMPSFDSAAKTSRVASSAVRAGSGNNNSSSSGRKDVAIDDNDEDDDTALVRALLHQSLREKEEALLHLRSRSNRNCNEQMGSGVDHSEERLWTDLASGAAVAPTMAMTTTPRVAPTHRRLSPAHDAHHRRRSSMRLPPPPPSSGHGGYS